MTQNDVIKMIHNSMDNSNIFLYTELCKKCEISRHNFSAFINKRQSLSLGTFLKILIALEVLPPGHNFSRVFRMNLQDFLYFYNNQEKLQNIFNVLDKYKEQKWTTI